VLTNVLLGTNDLARAEAFYDTLLSLFGAKQVMKNERSILWKPADNGTGIALCTPYDGGPATNGNGAMVGLRASSFEELVNIYETALRLGGSCEGAPGQRRPGVHAAYFRDPDLNKFGVFFIENAPNNSFKPKPLRGSA